MDAGVHVTLPDYYSPEHLGMIVPKTKDGRVVFMLPWLEATIAGTTGAASYTSPLTTVLSVNLVLYAQRFEASVLCSLYAMNIARLQAAWAASHGLCSILERQQAGRVLCR